MTNAARILAVVVMLFVGAAHALAQAVSCESMSLDPVVTDGSTPGGLGILDRFYVRAESVEGPVCWVHPHPNGRDFVITPPGWGQHPDSENQVWIDRTIQAITDSRNSLTAIGTLNVDLYILLTGLTADESGSSGIAEAYWLLDSDCWVEARQESRTDPHGLGDAADSFKFTIAHEIGHCFLMENIPNYVPQTSWILTVRWWDESGAEYLAAQVYPKIDREHYRAGAFDLDVHRWLQPYDSYVVLQHYANLHSPKAVIDLLTWFHEEGKAIRVEDVRRLLDAIYNHETFGDFYHDFAVTHYQSQVGDPGGGTIPRETYVDNYLEQNLLPSTGTIFLTGLLANRLNIVELTIPAGYDLRLAPPTGSPKRFAKTLWENGRFLGDWNSTAHIAGSCDYDTQARVLLTHHFELQIDDLEMTYWLDEKCPCGDKRIQDCCKKPRTSDLQPKEFRPYYKGSDPPQSWAACMAACNDKCWCRNKHMWSFEPVTKAECDNYWPNGTLRQHPKMLTICEGMTDPRNTRPAAKKDALDVYCEVVVCSQVCQKGR